MQKHKHLQLLILFCLVCIGILMSGSLNAQNKKLRINKKYDFGVCYEWDNQRAAIFTFKNESKQAVRVLPTRANREIYVDFPRKAILPGQTGQIEVYYYPTDKGDFSVSVPIYTNIDDEPFNLKIKGHIKSFAPNRMACPGSEPPRTTTPKSTPIPQPQLYEQTIVVIDGKSKRAIESPRIKITRQDGESEHFIAKDRGMLQLNLPSAKYVVEVKKEGYEGEKVTAMFNQISDELIVQLYRPEQQYTYKDSKKKESYNRSRYRESNERTEEKPKSYESNYDKENLDDWLKKYQTERDNKTQPEPKVSEKNKQYDKDDLEDWLAQHKDKSNRKKTEASDGGEYTQRTYTNRYYEQQREKEAKKRDKRKRKEEPKEQYVESNRERNEPIERAESNIETEESKETLSVRDYKANNIVFLLDVSKSMEKNDKLNLLKKSMKRLTKALRKIDKVTVIAYSSEANVVLPSIASDNKGEIYNAIDALEAGGGTRGVVGLEAAYKWIDNNYISNGNNQIILATDGEFRNNDTQLKELNDYVRRKGKKGILLSVVGFGQNKDAARLMRRLAYSGQGEYVNVEHAEDAEDVLLDEVKKNSKIRY